MTVSTDLNNARYQGNGVTDTFAFSGRIFLTSDLVVDIITRATDELVETLSVSDYTVTIINAESASVTVDAGKIPSASQDILIRRDIPFTQSLRLPTGTVFPAADVENGLDKAAIRDQQLSNAITRSLRYPDNVSGITNAVLPVPVDGTALVFSGTTGELITSETYIEDAIATATSGVTGTALVTATSTTSLTTTGTGNKTWTIQSGRGFAMGQRLRVSSDDGTKINEGRVTSYSGTTLIINVDYVSGSGTHADWNISVAGDRGAAGAGTGDMLGANNLSDVASAAAAFNTIKQDATDTNSGVVELATNAEVAAGTDTTRAVTPAGLASVLTPIQLQSSVATTSGTSVDLSTTIPSTVKRITIALSQVSTNGTSPLIIQVGSGSFVTTGYTGSTSWGTTVTNNSSGITANSNMAAALLVDGVITLISVGGNKWIASVVSANAGGATSSVGAGSITLSGALDRIRITTAGGANTFDAGSVILSWET